MGRNWIVDRPSHWKRQWGLTLCGLLGMQVSGICWSDEVPAAKRQGAPKSGAVTAGHTDNASTSEIVQVGHKHGFCNDPNCTQCRPKKKQRWCPPDWYTQSPLWQSMTDGTNAGGNQGMGGGAGAGAGMGNGDGGMGAGGQNNNPGFMDLASANPTGLAPNMIGDLFGPSAITAGGLSTFQGNAVLETRDIGTGPISVLHLVNGGRGSAADGYGNVFYAGRLKDAGTGIITPINVVQNPTDSRVLGDASNGKYLYAFTATGAPVLDADGNHVKLLASQTGETVNGGATVYQVGQYNQQAAAIARVGQLRIAENVSPMPRDRIFLNYNFFSDAKFSDTFNANVNRLTPGFEKTFMDGNASFELRAPFAATIDPLVTLGGAVNTDKVSFGNLNMTGKFLLYRTDVFALSTGLQVAVPTAKDTRIEAIDGVDLGRIYNRTTHVMPFIGFLSTPNDRFFSQGFIQPDVDASGSPVYANNFIFGPPGTNQLERVGKLQDQTRLYTSGSMGYWIHRADSYDDLIQGIAPVMELHSTTSLQRADYVDAGAFQAGDRNIRHREVINMVIGLHTQMRERRFISAAYAFPITGEADRQFKGEFRLMLNQLFGPVNNQTAAGFFGG